MKKLLIPLFSTLIFFINTSFASKDIETYSEKTCEDIYGAIGTFIILADIEWKEKNEEKALFYSTASANYATIYETVCRDYLYKK